jgi:hypothetical protein
VHELDAKLKARGLRVIAVTEVDPEDMAEDREHAASVAKDEHITYPCLLDKQGAWMRSAGIEGVPTFLVIDREGKLVYKYKGRVTPGSDAFQQLAAAVEKALGPG